MNLPLVKNSSLFGPAGTTHSGDFAATILANCVNAGGLVVMPLLFICIVLRGWLVAKRDDRDSEGRSVYAQKKYSRLVFGSHIFEIAVGLILYSLYEAIILSSLSLNFTYGLAFGL